MKRELDYSVSLIESSQQTPLSGFSAEDVSVMKKTVQLECEVKINALAESHSRLLQEKEQHLQVS